MQFANNNSLRNIYVLGLSLFLGISIPQYFAMHTDDTGHGPLRTSAGWVSTMSSYTVPFWHPIFVAVGMIFMNYYMFLFFHEELTV